MYQRSLLLGLVFLLIPSFVLAAAPPDITAESACVMVVNTKQILYDKQKDKIMYPASTTKIVTLLTALEKGKPDAVVTVSPQAAACDGSSLDLAAGDRLTLRELLYGMMLVSGNDAAEAVADQIGGSQEAFAAMMNQTAQRLGAERTHFSNPHGLPDPINHFTTANDMALITAAGYQRADFIQIVSAPVHKVAFLNEPIKEVSNTNRLLTSFAGANGVKTGYTDEAGECLVAAARRGGIQLIAVIYNSDFRWKEAAELLEYGFATLGKH